MSSLPFSSIFFFILFPYLHWHYGGYLSILRISSFLQITVTPITALSHTVTEDVSFFKNWLTHLVEHSSSSSLWSECTRALFVSQHASVLPRASLLKMPVEFRNHQNTFKLLALTINTVSLLDRKMMCHAYDISAPHYSLRWLNSVAITVSAFDYFETMVGILRKEVKWWPNETTFSLLFLSICNWCSYPSFLQAFKRAGSHLPISFADYLSQTALLVASTQIQFM